MFSHTRKFPELIGSDSHQSEYLTDRQNAQRLLALSSLIIPASFLFLYLIAPTASDLSSNPLVLIISIIIVAQAAIRLCINWKKALNDRYQFVCVLLDFFGLSLILLAYAITYEVPFSAALKSPTADVFFIFLASRIVLFNRSILIKTGLVAIISWICLVGIAVWDPSFAGRTSSFTEYLTSYKVLLGAEVERILQFGLITGVLLIFLEGIRIDAPTGFLRRLFFLGTLSRFLISNKSTSADTTFAFVEVRAKNIADVDSVYNRALKLIPKLPVLRDMKVAVIGRLSDQSAGLYIEYPKGAYELREILERIHEELSSQVTRKLASNAPTLIVAGCRIDPKISANRHLRYTDAAIREAIASGQNSLEFGEDLLAKIENKQFIERAIKLGLEKKKLSVAYQPIMDLMTDKPIGFEALIRLKDENNNPISPGVFIPIAETTGLIDDVTDYLCETIALEAPELCAIFEGHAVKPYININISPNQINDVDRILRALKRAEDGGVKINVEITESTVCDDDVAGRAFERLRQEGYLIAIDDFGTGYSSLQRLETLKFSTLKIDQSFVTNIGNRETHDFLSAVINLSRVTAQYTIVEGVETLEQKILLMKMGVRYCQGYYWTRPVSMDGLSQYLSESFGYKKLPQRRVGHIGFG